MSESEAMVRCPCRLDWRDFLLRASIRPESFASAAVIIRTVSTNSYRTRITEEGFPVN
jgi:hypothetical protein